ncbi:uncharacterized protein [Lolium perenne]|uniref:uncharacterized protein n=1 Tax=Lolium perenne TaxID=4522 RepID=UPI0021EA2FC6|nr:uncharacterized protein LOC127298397 [Lolium perenne]
MAGRPFVFEKNWAENPPQRRPTTDMEFPPGLPPADGHDPPQGWTTVRIECSHFRRPDGTPEILLLYGRPSSPDRHQPDTSTFHWGHHQQVHRRRSPEPHQVEGATRVVRFAKMISLDLLQDDEVYQEVLDELTKEARKFGDLVKVVVPRPGHGAADHPVVAGAGEVFLEYACLDHSIQCRIGLDGEWYDGRKIIAGYFPEDRFAAGDYDYDE